METLSPWIYDSFNNCIKSLPNLDVVCERGNISNMREFKECILDSKFVASFIKDDFIPSNFNKDYVSYSFKVSKNIHVTLYLFENIPIKIHEFVIQYIYTACLIIMKNQNQADQTEINIYLYFHEKNKDLPTTKGGVICTHNVNSGLTSKYLFSKGPVTIIIYRLQEWEKVLLHELIHAFGLDDHVSTLKYEKKSSLFQEKFKIVNTEFSLKEAYVEIIASIIYSGITYLLRNKGCSYKEFAKKYKASLNLLSKEYIQTAILLFDHFGIVNYPYTQDIKEDTNAFAYIVCKAAFMNEDGYAIVSDWIVRHKMKLKNLNHNFIDDIQKCLESKYFKKKIENYLKIRQ